MSKSSSRLKFKLALKSSKANSASSAISVSSINVRQYLLAAIKGKSSDFLVTISLLHHNCKCSIIPISLFKLIFILIIMTI
ncbi:hypothetical protein HOF65_06910 [bacterium]|nr:hypothetical protein [bacterium]MBT3853649.1 hypothetical protein [bacterium]MBT4633327.1 hypothetical protein [bacterium]MBT6779312.1 hypothetical protein [bacterium]